MNFKDSMHDNRRWYVQKAIGGLFMARAREPASYEPSCKPKMSALGQRENYLLALLRASLQKKPGFVCRVFGISNAEGSTFEYAPARARTMD